MWQRSGLGLVVAGLLATFLGAFIGSRLLKKMTIRWIAIAMGIMLFLLSMALGTGLV
ncbi:MAG: hypothetical protein WBM69_19420 [Desulfobacterales bacterium]